MVHFLLIIFQNLKIIFFSLIVNLSNEGETGTHFIAIFITENKILYFDSLGSFQINPNIKHYLETYKKPISYDQKQIQHLLSSHCGFFCIAFIICIENMIQTKFFLKIFHKRKLYLNDFICEKIITNFIRCRNTNTINNNINNNMSIFEDK